MEHRKSNRKKSDEEVIIKSRVLSSGETGKPRTCTEETVPAIKPEIPEIGLSER